MTQMTITPTWTLGDRLRKARDVAGITSQDMADRLGVSRNTITNYENDHTSPSVLAVRAYASETGVDIEWLYGTTTDARSRCFPMLDPPGPGQLEFHLAA